MNYENLKMFSKTYILITLIFLLFAVNQLSAQYMMLYDVDYSEFPKINAKLIAIDENGDQIIDISKSDLKLTENGAEREILSITCPTEKDTVPISSVLTIDVSGSMKSPKIDWAKEAAFTWINLMNLGISECALTTFSQKNAFNMDFTTDREKLLNAVDQLLVGGGTSFNAAFITPEAGALLAAAKGMHKKVVVMLTDGKSDGDTARIIEQAKAVDASVYNIVIEEKCPDILKVISNETGGEWFEDVMSGRELKDLYTRILLWAQKTDPCTIEWTSGKSCESNLIDVELTLFRPFLKASSLYLSPAKSIVSVKIKPKTIAFKNVPPSGTEQKTITIEAINSDFNITGITSNNDKFNITPNSFVLPEGEQKILTVTFSPEDSVNQYCKFVFENPLCPAEHHASAYYQNEHIDEKTIRLTHPNGGETFVAGTDTMITWEGISPDEKVVLEYSFNDGKSWNVVSSSASDLEYNWNNIPNTPSQKCLAKVRQVGNSSTTLTKLNALSGHSQEINDINWSPDGSKIVSTGIENNAFIWDSETGDRLHTLIGHENTLFQADWSPDGSKIVTTSDDETAKIWDAKSGNMLHTLSGHTHVVFDSEFSPDGNYAATASFDATAKIWDANNGSLVHTLSGHGDRVYHISWSPDGKYLATTSRDSTVIVWNIAEGTIHQILENHFWEKRNAAWSPDGTMLAAGGNSAIYIWGAQNGEVLQELSTNNFVTEVRWNNDGIHLAANGQYNIWNVFEGKSLFQLDAAGPHIDWNPDQRLLASDRIIWDAFTGTALKHLDSSVFNAVWAPDGERIAAATRSNDIVIWKFMQNTIQQDISDENWSIVVTHIKSFDVDMEKNVLGSKKDSLVSNFLTNDGSYKIRIDSIVISGKDKEQFSVISSSYGLEIPPGSAKDIEFQFEPASEGIKDAVINIYTQTGKLEQKIIGEGVNPILEVESKIIDFGQVYLGKNKSLNRVVLKNISDQEVQINSAVLAGPDTEQFIILSSTSSFIINSGEKKSFDLQFKPVEKGRTSCNLNFYFDHAGSPVTTQLYGEGIIGCDETELNYPNFMTIGGLKLAGTAKQPDSSIMLTPRRPLTAGAMWNKNLVPVSQGFSTTFTFKIERGTNSGTIEDSYPGADGLAFVIQNSDSMALGADGGGIGYENIKNSIAIEIDLFNNDDDQFISKQDPNGNHIAIQSLGADKNSAEHTEEALIGLSKKIPLIRSDGTVYHVKIVYNYDPGVMNVFLDNTGAFSLSSLVVDSLYIGELLNLKFDEGAYVGFTAATGSAFQEHHLLSWHFCPKPSDGPITQVEEQQPKSSNKPIAIIPNPAADKICIIVNDDIKGSAYPKIYNSSGIRIEAEFMKTMAENYIEYKLDVSQLAVGYYRFVVNTGSKVISESFAVIR